ncbi:MAG TPA: hypothetical protein VMB51_12145 [Solirubrobacteraceae bacterium]|nr:hypothetical protein [Solirubrobacteraceae bacterium]
MAGRWADYMTIAARFDAERTRIQALQIRIDSGRHFGAMRAIMRPDVIALLEGGYTFCTATRNERGAWQRGAELNIVVVDGERFIRTRGDQLSDHLGADSLDGLPAF